LLLYLKLESKYVGFLQRRTTQCRYTDAPKISVFLMECPFVEEIMAVWSNAASLLRCVIAESDPFDETLDTRNIIRGN